MAWYNKYRPTSFADVIGQNLVKTVLQNAISKDKVKHAYLLSGSKGVGKTTLARIFADELNGIKQNPEARIDLIELDAASNTGIDDVRILIESAKTPPLVGPRKIYIIDEVHMLSKPAMNALLKILEEPPAYLVFLLATTNPEKLIPTVLSRLTKLNLSTHTEQDIVLKLEQTSQSEGLKIDPAALKIIAKRSNGSQRDAINLLETLASYELESYDSRSTAELLGLLPEELLSRLSLEFSQIQSAVIPGLTQTSMELLRGLSTDGDTLLAQLLDYLLELSLSGRTEFDSLILPLASTLDMRLPLTDPIGAVALFQVNLRTGLVNSNPPQNLSAGSGSSLNHDNSSPISPAKADKPEKVEPKNLAEKELPMSQVIPTPSPEGAKTEFFEEMETETVEFSDSGGLDKSQAQASRPTNLSQMDSLSMNLTDSDKREDGVLKSDDLTDVGARDSQLLPTQESVASLEISPNLPETSQLEKFFLDLSRDSATPAFLKMILPDIQIVQLNSTVLTLGFSNGLFLGQFQNDKIQALLKLKLKSVFNLDVNLEGIILKKTQSAKTLEQSGELNNQMVEFQEKAHQNDSQTSNEDYQTSHKEVENGQAFYSVYRSLPKEIEQLPIPVLQPPLPEPSKMGESWEDHANELFEFE
jgi:DNA polymerase III subunit gamma/tau